MNIKDYLKNLKAHQQSPATIFPNGSLVIYSPIGELSHEEFERHFPIAYVGQLQQDNGKGENSDRTKAWMNETKSP